MLRHPLSSSDEQNLVVVYSTEEKNSIQIVLIKKLWHVKQRQFKEWGSCSVTVRHVVNIVAVIQTGEEN